jgi:hypothetical protein
MTDEEIRALRESVTKLQRDVESLDRKLFTLKVYGGAFRSAIARAVAVAFGITLSTIPQHVASAAAEKRAKETADDFAKRELPDIVGNADAVRASTLA